MAFYDGDKPGKTPGLLPDPYYCKYIPLSDIAPWLMPLQGGRPALSWAP